MHSDALTPWDSVAIWLLVATMPAMASNGGDESTGGRTTTTIECGIPGERRSQLVDMSRCFVGDLCCCRYDAFDLADLLLTEEETVLVGRVEEVAGLPESLMVRRDVQATIGIHKVFRNAASTPPPKIRIRLSSDMFLWPETGASRIVARQAMAGEHEAMDSSIRERLESLEAAWTNGEIDSEAYGNEKSRLAAESERTGELRWDWEGELGVVWRRRAEPFPNCDNGVFTVDRGGALEVGGTYLLVLNEANGEADVEYLLSDNAPWNVFTGEEMDEIVHALSYTNACLSWPEIVYGPENEHVAISICADWARGRTLPYEVGRRR